MKAYGNGTPETCVSNLCSLLRGEVYGDRCRGVDGRLIDKSGVSEEMTEDIKWLVKEYEPRVDVDDIEVSEKLGDFAVTVKMKKRGEQ